MLNIALELERKDNAIMNFEILRRDQEIWDNFTRREEYNPLITDKYGRFPQFASKCRNIFEPEVSKYLIENGMQFDYPDKKNFALCLTHDIDWVYQSISVKSFNAFHLLKNLRFNEAFDVINNMRSRRRPLLNFKEIMLLEKDFGAKSAFYILVQRQGDQDYSYDIEDLKNEIGTVRDEGFEVGLHGGHNSYLNPNAIKDQKRNLEKILNCKIYGYRNHFLRFKVPQTWQYLADAGFEYDTTMGYPHCAGFRNGMCHPYKPYNLNSNQFMDILEIPLIIMDTSLFEHMKLDLNDAWRIVKLLIDNVEKNRGIVTILWHNHNILANNSILYKKILKYGREKNAWMTSAEDVCKWWKENVI